MVAKNQRHAIFVNGLLTAPEALLKEVRSTDYIIGVDGGTDHVVRLGLIPSIVVGDLDSISPKNLESLEKRGIPILKYDPRKDETDLELAIAHSASLNPQEVILFSPFGGRVDHALANLMLLTRPTMSGSRVTLFDGEIRMILVRPGIPERIKGELGSKFSLIPISGDVHVEKLSGSEWELVDTVLHLGIARGLSNIFRSGEVEIQTTSGLLLAISGI